MNLVYSFIAKEFPKHIGDEDLIQCGMVGLCNAADKWDESKSEFSTFAWMCIRHEILREFRSRKKHYGVLSLDYEINIGDGERTPVGETMVGEEDIDYVDTEDFLAKLTPVQKQVFLLKKQGVKDTEIAQTLGVSVTMVGTIRRKLQALWHHFYG
jgi:RNA polymerase sigma factor (sigma-70 family)